MDAEPQAILVARRDLARLEHPARPAFEAQQRGDIVVEAPARHMRREFGAERFDRQPRDMFGELKGVGSDVAEAAAEARARGIGAPFGLLVAVPVDRPAQPALRSEEHTSELQSLMRISYAVFCLKKKIKNGTHENTSEMATQITDNNDE